jgi:hypothetical protein
MIETLNDLFNMKKRGFLIKAVEIKDWGNRVVINFIQYEDNPNNGSDLIVEFNHCQEIIWQFLGSEEYVKDVYADVIVIEIRPENNNMIKLIIHCVGIELIIRFGDFEVLSA